MKRFNAFILLCLMSLNSFAAPGDFNPFPPTPIEPGSLSNKAEVFSHDGAADAVLAPGTDGQVLTRDDAEVTGLKWAEAGAGGGGLDTFYVEDFEGAVNAASFTSGNNATFDNGGVLDGVISDETVSPLNKLRSFKYVLGASSTDDWVKSPDIGIFAKQSGNTATLTFSYKYNGSGSDIRVIAYDGTGSEILTEQSVTLSPTTNSTRFSVRYDVPDSSVSLNWGVHVLNGNPGKELVIEDVEKSTDPFTFTNVIETPVVVKGAGNGGGSIISLVTDVDFTETRDATSSWNGTQFVAPEKGDYLISGNIRWNTNNIRTIFAYVDGAQDMMLNNNFASGGYNSFSQNIALEEDEVLSIRSALTDTLSNNILHHHITITKIPKTESNFITHTKKNAPNSMIRLHTGNGFGSTSTQIRRFSTLAEPIKGNAVTYTDSSSLGSEFLIEEDGIFFINYTDAAGSTSNPLGISLNSTQLTTSISAITAADRLAITYTGNESGEYAANVSWSGILKKGDIIRAHTTSTSSTNDAKINFTISKIGTSDLLGVQIPGITNSDLTNIHLAGNTGQVIGAVVAVPFTEVNDTKGEWDGLTFAPNSSGRFTFQGSTNATTSLGRGWYLYVNRQGGGYAQEQILNTATNVSQSIAGINGALDLLAGDLVQIRETTVGATLLDDDRFHFLNITQSADTASLIANLSEVAAGSGGTTTSKGQVQTHNGTTQANLDPGADGQFLVTDSTTATGLKYVDTLQGSLSPITDWVSYTPVTQGLGSITGPNFKYRQVGESVEIQGTLTAGTTTGVEAQIGLPSGLVIDSSIGSLINAGSGFAGGTSNGVFALVTGGDDFLNLGIDNTAGAINGNTALLVGSQLTFSATVPIQGWKSGLGVITRSNELFSQEKILSSDITSNQTVSELEITGLKIGTRYRLNYQTSHRQVSSAGGSQLTAMHDGVVLGRSESDSTSSGNNGGDTNTTTSAFVATTTSITFEATVTASSYIRGEGNKSETFSQVTEEPLTATIAATVEYADTIQGRMSFASDWKNYTPTFVGLGTATNIKFKYRQDGTDMLILGEFQTGNPVGTVATFTLPNNELADLDFNGVVGRAAVHTPSDTYNDFTLLGANADNTIGFSTVNNSSFEPLTRQTGGALFGASKFVNIKLRVPIKGWTTGLDVVAQTKIIPILEAHSNVGGACSITAACEFVTKVKDTTNSWNGTKYVAPEDGEYILAGSIRLSVSANNTMYPYVNGIKGRAMGYDGTASSLQTFNGIVSLKEGDELEIRTDGAYSLNSSGTHDTIHFLKIQKKLSGKEVIAAVIDNINDSNLTMIEAKGHTGQVIGTTTAIPFTEVEDAKGEWDGTTFAPKEDGRYSFDLSIFTVGGAPKYLYFYVNRQSAGYVLEDIIKNNCNSDICVSKGAINLQAGDTVQVVDTVSGFTLSTASPTMNRAHYLYITQSADSSSIIKNLSLTADRCQTKFLVASTTSTGIMTDFTFNNLKTGTVYQVTPSMVSASNAQYDFYNSATVTGSPVAYLWGQTNSLAGTIGVPTKFTASSDTLIVNKIDTVNTYGNGNITNSWVELCEKGNTVLTTEF